MAVSNNISYKDALVFPEAASWYRLPAFLLNEAVPYAGGADLQTALLG